MGFDFVWRSTFKGLQVSRPIRDIIAYWSPNDMSFMYMNGKLFINGGVGELLVLHVEQQRGWGKYQYPLNSRSEAVLTFDEGRRAVIVNRNQPVVEIEVAEVSTDYDAVTTLSEYIDWTITTHKWQYSGGRSIVEHRWISLMADLTEQIQIQPYVNGRIWSVPFGVLPDPADYPHVELQETEYQGYSEIKPIGNFLHYKITGNKPTTIYSIMVNCLVQLGSIAPGFDPFQVLALAARVPPWASTSNDYEETGVATTEIVETGTQTTEIVEGL
jgi:hypothetical protein